MFISMSENSENELNARTKNLTEPLEFGIDFLDHSLGGIFKEDLILIGAPSGVGKTQLCCNIVMANMNSGKRIHYIALEAGEYEIERRFKFPHIAERYFADEGRPKLKTKFNFSDWYIGRYAKEFKKYEADVSEFFQKAYIRVSTLYKGDKFGLTELIESVLQCSEETDLIIIDHVHYFDFEDDNENRAIKQIAKMVRTLALENKIPIILVAHMRKSDRRNPELVPGLEEFHGSSDLYKIATKVITFSPGKSMPDGTYETFFRTPKNRFNGSSSRFMGREFFSPRKGGYESNKYELGWCDQQKSDGFKAVELSSQPEWARARQSQTSDSSSGNGDLRYKNVKRWVLD